MRGVLCLTRGFRYSCGLLCLLIFGCATPPRVKAPSEYLLSTDRNTTEVMSLLKNKFSEHKYKVAREDIGAGLLLFEPKSFSFDRKNGTKVKTRQTIHIRHEGGSVKVHIIYSCDHGQSGDTFKPCFEGDQLFDRKTEKIESALVEDIKPLLLRHGQK